MFAVLTVQFLSYDENYDIFPGVYANPPVH